MLSMDSFHDLWSFHDCLSFDHNLHLQAILHSFKTVLTEEVRMILRSTLLFEDWSDADIDFLASRAIVRNYGSNTEIQKSGEKVNCLSMIKSGEFIFFE